MIKWKKNKNIYSNGVIGCLGKWRIFYLFWDGSTSKDDPKKYRLICELPGLKTQQKHFKFEIDGKEKADKILSHWLKHSGLNIQ